LATVGGKITAAFLNLIVAQVNKQTTATITPTSVAGTGVSLDSTGLVIMVASPTALINGAFPGGFSAYRITGNLFAMSAGSAINAQFALSGTALANASTYDSVTLYNSLTTTAPAGAAYAAANAFRLVDGALTQSTFDIVIHDPTIATRNTRAAGVFSGYTQATPQTITGATSAGFRTVGAVDGLNLMATTSGATMNGWVRIVGIA
jgi:hypothetical protein